MNIVIPMSGQGSRFVEAGYNIPKPFIPIKGKAMIEHVIDNISSDKDKVYLISRIDHMEYFRQTRLLDKDNISIVLVDKPTEGAACTVLRAKTFIDNNEPLLLANSDQFIVYDKIGWNLSLEDCDASIMTFKSDHPKWSYVKKLGDKVTEVAEKRVISELASVGIYYFKHGKTFVKYAKEMIDNNLRVNNEFYVCPVFNLIVDKYNVNTFDVEAMYGLGTPEDLKQNYEFIGVN